MVGVTYAAIQGRLIVGNPFMDAMVELNKSERGMETEVLEENCLTPHDAVRAVMMLKAKMGGERIIAAEREWNPEVTLRNMKLIEQAAGRKMALQPNRRPREACHPCNGAEKAVALAVVKGLQSEISIPVAVPPVWAEVKKPLDEMVVALVTAGGVHLKKDQKFTLSGDSSFRIIPGDCDCRDLMVSHGGYDNSDVNQDINCMFPLERLKDLAERGVIGRVAPVHVGFMGGGGNVEVLREVTGPEIAEKLIEARVDAVVMTGG